MIHRESYFTNIKNIIYGVRRKIYYDFCSISCEELEYISDNISMLGLYLSYLEYNKIDYKISVRPNKKYHFNKCFVHNCRGVDYPFIILEKEGLFACHGCNYSGHIVDFIAGEYDLSKDETLKIIYSFINKEYESLNEEEKELYNKIFYKYELKDYYNQKSEEKSKYINERILRYAELNQDKDISCIAKRLAYTEDIVKRVLKR